MYRQLANSEGITRTSTPRRPSIIAMFFYCLNKERMSLACRLPSCPSGVDMADPIGFVHLLLFRCPACNSPIPSAVTSDKRNLEDADAMPVMLGCNCGWTGTSVGAGAMRHWVESWESNKEDHTALLIPPLA